MSANADRLTDFYTAVAANDFDLAAKTFAPDVEIRTRLESHRGIDAARRMLDEAFSEFDATLDIRDVIEPAPDIVIARYGLGMRGRHTQIEASQEVVDVAHFRDGLVHLVEVFSSLDEALESLG